GQRWCEIARPQIHGHDFRCTAIIPCPHEPGNFRYASGSEEKMIRVLEAPQAFVDTLALAKTQSPQPFGTSQGYERALGAAVGALGLSNKAVFAEHAGQPNAGIGSGLEGGNYAEGPDLAPNAAPGAAAGPPLEEHLASNTLWPEIIKLYGHGSDLFALSAHPDGTLLASTCKAQIVPQAAIWLWDTSTWQPLGKPLEAHGLTVTQLAFSPDGQHLLSASRDRTFALWARCTNAQPGDAQYDLLGKVKAHARIIWTISWAPDGRHFATGSRDGTVKVWQLPTTGPPSKPLQTISSFGKAASVTALAFTPAPAAATATGAGSPAAQPQPATCLAVGLEDGSISLCSMRENQPLLASCGDDHTVRIFSVHL
ncbi:hypothetical protein WJX84_012082, partial [Apatococcus fuscideae]